MELKIKYFRILKYKKIKQTYKNYFTEREIKDKIIIQNSLILKNKSLDIYFFIYLKDKNKILLNLFNVYNIKIILKIK